MEIGEPKRTIIVEPIEVPAVEPELDPEPPVPWPGPPVHEPEREPVLVPA